ncbi:MAG: fumarate hydratase [Deltaproteobacteria bacterium]|jgi:fumarate hydratase subunit alpha|nr:fumarate hydratase [Deltaproteobacteria bacterium]
MTGEEDGLAAELPDLINESGPGPMGLGGRATAPGLRVRIQPRHIVALPAAAALNCHCLRTARLVV